MAKVGRNAPCPCGSGKKYKRCCWEKPNPDPSSLPHGLQPPLEIVLDYEDLDDLSNSVLTLIKEGRFDEADAVCDDLAKRYPDQIDCIERRGLVMKARGRPLEAAALYRQAAEFARTHDGFDQDGIDWYLERAQALETDTK
jgi:tetratricopeptide (TPR) repeat protein